jgi:transcriptional regulator of acetoin/glycerol metabolism
MTLPPLRQRKDAIPLLEKYVSTRHGKSVDHIPNALLESLKCHSWPGNIRELQI